MTPEEHAVQDWRHRIQAEYLEMPGLQLTKPQVRRMWRIDAQLCDVVLDSLVASAFLKKTCRDAYALAQVGA